MRYWLRTVLAGSLMAAVLSVRLAAVSVEDLVNLKVNGLSDDVLVALIESDGSVFRLSAADVVALSKRGIGEKVLLAMIATSRAADLPRAERPRADREVPTIPATSPDVQVHQSVVQNVAAPTTVIVPVPIAVPLPVVTSARPEPPVYWGFSGRPRPGGWKPATEPDRRPASDPTTARTR